MALVIPTSCGGGGSDEDIPQPTPTPQPPVNVDPITGLSSLDGILQVDQETSLLSGLTFATGVELTKTEILFEGQRTEIADPKRFTPEFPGACSLIFTIKKDGTTSEVKAENLSIKPLEYKAVAMNAIKPVDILPIVWQVEVWDIEAYDHIEHLKLAEATRIVDMMWEYGAGDHSSEEYQALMLRLNTGMMGENPKWYDNYESVWWTLIEDPSNHAHDEWNILNTLVKHANYKVINSSYDLYGKLYDLCINNPNSINIMWISIGSDVDKKQYDAWEKNENQLLKEKNVILLCSWGNIREKNGVLLNKVCQENYNLPDKHSCYAWLSAAHDKKDMILDRHILVTLGTNKVWDTDQTNQTYGGSKFPIWFHDKILFAWRAFPYSWWKSWDIIWESWKYDTSYTNYTNVCMMDICFQLFAEVKDVDELLEMVRSTALTDYIRFDLNGDGDTDDEIDGQPETQPLQLMNPVGFILKYLMPTNLPSSIKLGETINLGKGYYHGIIFDIPGAEVKINGEWIAFTENNKATILAQNPFALEWRLNADATYLRKLGYKSGDTLQGQIIVIDDQYNALNITQDIAIKVTE